MRVCVDRVKDSESKKQRTEKEYTQEKRYIFKTEKYGQRWRVGPFLPIRRRPLPNMQKFYLHDYPWDFGTIYKK